MNEKQTASRLSQFKLDYPLENCKQSRINFQMSLRKDKRLSCILKNRNLSPKAISKSETLESPLPSESKSSSLIQNLRSSREKCSNNKILLSEDDLKSISNLISASLGQPDIQSLNQSICLLIDLSMFTSPHIITFLDSLVPSILNLIDSKNPTILENSIWFLSNHSLTSLPIRQHIIKNLKLGKIYKIVQSSCNTNLSNVALWLLSNLVRADPQPQSANLSEILELFIVSLPKLTHVDTKAEVLFGISSLNHLFPKNLSLFESRYLRTILKFSIHLDPSLQLPALKIIEKMIRLNLKVQELKNLNLIQFLSEGFYTKSSRVLRQICRVVEEIMGNGVYGSRDFVVRGIVDKIVESICFTGARDHEVMVKDLMIIAQEADDQSFYHLLNGNLVRCFCGLVTSASAEVKGYALGGILYMLKNGEKLLKAEELLNMLEEIELSSGFEALDILSYDKNSQISSLSTQILEFITNHLTS